MTPSSQRMALAVVGGVLAATALAAVPPRAPGRRVDGGYISQTHPLASVPAMSDTDTPHPTSLNCTWKYFTQRLDHFNEGATAGGDATFSQRYCVYEGFTGGSAPNVILFYTGNEAPVEQYVNNTGLMWTLGPKYNALLVFAEHRYEGESFPNLENITNCMSYCTSQQALADFATLIRAIKVDYTAPDAAVVAFGGSYGGMLSAWFRIKYPNVIAGAIAASAPIWGLPLTHPTPDDYAVAISRGVSAAGGATDQCFDNLAAAMVLLHAAGQTASGRATLSKAFRTCNPLTSTGDVDSLLQWAQGPWFDMAEGNYPFPSTYITYNVGPGFYPLPAWPMRVACSLGLNEDLGVKFEGNRTDVKYTVTQDGLSVDVDWDQATVHGEAGPRLAKLASGLAAAVDVWYNVSGTLTCNDVSAGAAAGESTRMPKSVSPVCGKSQESLAASWGGVCCNEQLHMTNIMARGMGRDFFWPPNKPRDFNVSAEIERQGQGNCRSGVHDDQGYPAVSDPWSAMLDDAYGGVHIEAASNIVFSNGLLDPWSSGGVVTNLSSSLTAVILDLGAHHLDLMWPTANDPPCAIAARKTEEAEIEKWVTEHHARTAARRDRC
eukprot:m.101523 g.101523  ORF g.101523 m.101523 type:complete len:605 (+) comp10396_c0_seq1:1641-3455(+)